MERDFINSLMSCDSNKEVNEIRDLFKDLLRSNPAMYNHIFAARKRINRINKAKFENWEIDLLN
jgi:hypothetical protein